MKNLGYVGFDLGNFIKESKQEEKYLSNFHTTIKILDLEKISLIKDTSFRSKKALIKIREMDEMFVVTILSSHHDEIQCMKKIINEWQYICENNLREKYMLCISSIYQVEKEDSILKIRFKNPVKCNIRFIGKTKTEIFVMHFNKTDCGMLLPHKTITEAE